MGIIGTGASGIQVAQEASKVSTHVTVFQRTPNMFLPMGQQQLTAEDNARRKATWPANFQRRGECFGGFDFDFIMKSALEYSQEERDAIYERLWTAGGFNFWLGTFFDIFTNEAANRTAYDFWRNKVRARIKDPKLADMLAPMEPPHPYAVKRPSLEQWYFDLFNRDNTTLVSLKETPIEEVLPTGLRTSAGVHEFDLLVFATGFDAVTGGLTSMDILSADRSTTIKDKWRKGVRTQLGVATSGFPNLLFSYGPQSPSGFCNGPSSAEYQGECIVELLVHLRAQGHRRIEAEPAAEQHWRDHIMELAQHTLFPKADSWYMGANIPGKQREMLMYPGGLPQYLKEFAASKDQGYAGFRLS